MMKRAEYVDKGSVRLVSFMIDVFEVNNPFESKGGNECQRRNLLTL